MRTNVRRLSSGWKGRSARNKAATGAWILLLAATAGTFARSGCAPAQRERERPRGRADSKWHERIGLAGNPRIGSLTRFFHTHVAADVSRHWLHYGKSAPIDVGGYT